MDRNASTFPQQRKKANSLNAVVMVIAVNGWIALANISKTEICACGDVCWIAVYWMTTVVNFRLGEGKPKKSQIASSLGQRIGRQDQSEDQSIERE